MRNYSVCYKLYEIVEACPHWALDAYRIRIQSALIASALQMRKTKLD